MGFPLRCRRWSRATASWGVTPRRAQHPGTPRPNGTKVETPSSGIAPAGRSGVSSVGSGHSSGFLIEGHGGESRRAVWGLIKSAPVAQPVVERGGGHGPGYEEALRLVAAQAL